MLLFFSRIFDRIVQGQLREFLKVNSILTNNQYAFRTLYSIIVFIVNSTEQWRHIVNMTIILDLKKAFDPFDHNILIDKLMKYGINEKELNGLNRT